jgi:hypothetical protein
MSLLSDWVAARRERQEQESRLATLRHAMARAAAAEEGRTLSEILTRASKTETAYPPSPSRRVLVGSMRPGQPWALI